MNRYNTLALLAAAAALIALDLLATAVAHHSPLAILFGAIAGCGAYYAVALPILGILNAQVDQAPNQPKS